MISKVAQQYPRPWHEYIGMFALRESVNETTDDVARDAENVDVLPLVW